MNHLLATISLTEDYTPSPIDDTGFDDFDNWTVPFGSITGVNSSHLQVASALFHGKSLIRAYNGFPSDVTTENGAAFRVTIDVTTDQDVYVQAIPYQDGFPLDAASYSNEELVAIGTDTVDLDFTTFGYSFDRIEIRARRNDATAFTVDLENVSIVSTDGGDFDSGDRILVYWDDVAEDFYVEREDNPGATLTPITFGPNLGFLSASQVTGVNFSVSPARSEYQFCDATELVRFRFTLSSPAFPYLTMVVVPDVPECAVVPVVCDITWTADPVLTPSTNEFSGDGSVQIAASSSFGPVRYTDQADLFYSEISNTSGLFEDLAPGLYTLYALDSKNCRIAISARVRAATATSYATKYSLEYLDKQTGIESTIEILERGFSGTAKDIKGDGMPFSIQKNPGSFNDKFTVLRPTLATFNVISERNFQFIGLFSQDDLKYRVQYEHGTSSWTGYLTPSVYNEKWVGSSRYSVALQAADNLNTLSTVPFLDESGNLITGLRSHLEIICTCLKKTSLSINIISAINRFAAGMDSDVTDDPLPQAFIDCTAFFDENDGTPKNCAEVLEMILKPYGVFIQQINSKWRIVETDSQTTPYTYREFTINGAYVGNGTIDPIVEIAAPTSTLEDVIFIENRHNLDIIPAYGKIETLVNLRPRASVFPLSLDEWTASMAQAGTNIKLLYFTVPGKIFQGVKFTNFWADSDGANKYPLLLSPEFVTTSANDGVELSFTYKALFPEFDSRAFNRYLPPLWVRLLWRLRLTVGSDTFYFSEVAGWNQDADYKDNRLYISQFLGEDASFDRVIDLPSITPAAPITLQLQLRFEGTQYWDFSNLAGIHAINTTVLPAGTKIRGRITTSDWSFLSASGVFWYTLDASTDPESNSASELPSVIRPTDYNGSTNAVVWRMDPGSKPLVKPIDTWVVSDLKLRFLPDRKDAPEVSSQSQVINENFKESWSYELQAGDIPADIIQHEIYLNVFRLADGTPTSGWFRKDFNEARLIQELLSTNLVNQYRKPTWRLAGPWLAPDLNFGSILKHTIPPIAISLVNEEDPNGAGWSQSGAGQAWTGSSPYTEVDFDEANTGNSLYVTQEADNLVAGSRVRVEFSVQRLNSSGDRIDRLVAVLIQGAEVVQKVTLANGLRYDTTITQPVVFTLDSDADEIGFFIENISGDGQGDATYRVDYFRVIGVSMVRHYALDSFERSDRDNRYQLTCVQLLPVVSGQDDEVDDSGGGNTGNESGEGVLSGGAFSDGFSNGFLI